MSDPHWQLLADARGIAGADQARFLAAVEESLAAAGPEATLAFDDWLRSQCQRANRWDLWGAAYVMSGGCGDDGFDYFRPWLVAQGSAVFEAALKDPESLADAPVHLDPEIGAPEFEELLYVAAEVYEAQTGQELPLLAPDAPTEIVGEEWNEEDLPKLFPRLASAYGF